MKLHHELRVSALAASALVLCSCVVKDGSLDFTWWKDAAAPVMEDDVVIESGAGQRYHATPAPIRIPEASIPKEEPVTPAPPPAAQPQRVASQQQPAVAAPATHIVRRGDTLSAIARRYKTSVKALVAANNMAHADAPLRVNQVLNIPQSSKHLSTLNTRSTLQPAPRNTPGIHVIQPGDTIYRIARQYGIHPALLMQTNGLTPATADSIKAGATLRIPAAH